MQSVLKLRLKKKEHTYEQYDEHMRGSREQKKDERLNIR